LEKLAAKSIRLRILYGEIADAMLSIPPFSLGYPSDLTQSAYYPGDDVITKEEIALISRALEERSIYPENTRIRKAKMGVTPIFEVLQASIEKGEAALEFSLPQSGGIVKLIRGDHSEELTQISFSLDKARGFAANENQKDLISQYIHSFQTGSLHAYRDSQRSWIKDKSPHVENIFGFVEPYRDPYGVRAEFEGLVAISDAEETKSLTRLVEHSTMFIRKLPWVEGMSIEYGEKGPFEKELFDPPDFTSIHGTFELLWSKLTRLFECSLSILL
jgi:dipeptidyl-peptidase III